MRDKQSQQDRKIARRDRKLQAERGSEIGRWRGGGGRVYRRKNKSAKERGKEKTSESCKKGRLRRESERGLNKKQRK